MLIHGVTYSRVMPITEDAAIDRLNTLCRGSALYPHYGTPGLAFPFGWTKAFRRNPPFVMHSPRPLRPTPSPG